MDFKTFVDKVAIENGSQKKFLVVIGEGTFIPGFEDQLVGMKEGEEKKFSLRFPKNYHDKNLADKMVDFEVKVNGVYEITLPELDDEFAQSIGNFKNVAELKKQMQDNLVHEAEHKEKHRLEDEILDEVIKISKFGEIPEILVNSETQKMVSELEENIKQQGLQFEDYLQHLKISRSNLLLEFAPQAVKRIKSALVIRVLAKEHNISVTNS
ncbi:MAG: trigger factor, partial [Bacteroidota bacterium]|nr:trigger factor [Bacteroidota bacterium]